MACDLHIVLRSTSCNFKTKQNMTINMTLTNTDKTLEVCKKEKKTRSIA